MKGWPGLIVGVYALLFFLLTTPLIVVCFGREVRWDDSEAPWFLLWTWVVAGVLAGAAILLLMVPVRAAQGRPVSRRRLLVPVLTSGFLLALLVYAGVGSLCLGIWGDDFPDGKQDWAYYLPVPLLWITWGAVFLAYSRSRGPMSLVNRYMRWLFAGSILELLVAVPCHVICRNRDDCCAPFGTFIGIAAGTAVMFLSMGPGVLLLYARRMRDLRARVDSAP